MLVLVTPHPAVSPAQRRRLLDAHPRVTVELVDTREAFEARLPEADGAVTSFGIPDGLLAGAPNLRWVHVMSAGVERMLTPELAAAEQIALTASKGPMGQLMAEHVVALMLALARNLPGFQRDQAEHRWHRMMAEGRQVVELVGKSIAILGVGEVGGHVARICRVGLGMGVLGMARTRRDNPHVDRYFEPAELHAALAEADVVSLSMPVTAATHHIIDRAALAAMKPTAYLINVARGQLVDEAALTDALRAGQIAGAGLDAFAAEPLAADSPLWDLPNVLITPHASAVTDRLGDHFVDFWAENIRRFAEGRPLLGVVDRQAGY
ncbi:MAG TPA: D-2-hydroxyacid dehydrogenase [Chloroflexota bacterium]